MGENLTVVLDTCALLWWSLDPDELSSAALKALSKMEQSKDGITSTMAIWEIAIKVKNQKLDLGIPLSKYINRVQQSDVVKIVAVETDLLVESVNLKWSHRDPVDRIMVALASFHDASIITRDKKIKDFYSNVIW
ncbi:MAG TPA: type II toxin-antitoxin system VapC family toxin [Coleofasciculaceae cyanobacterium]|jgi:PIN domain nuclease of toxin-antitoxin system